MNPGRRLFLQNAALSVAAASLIPSAFAQKPLDSQRQIFSPENLTLFDGVSIQTFEPWVGATFGVSLNNKPRGSLILLSVDAMNPEAQDEPSSSNTVRSVGLVLRPASGPAMTNFALHFRGSGAALPQDTYLLSHNWLGTFPLLLVPSGLSGPRPTCTAVFSVLNPAGLKKSE
jgi:hypothetical protein